MATMATIRFVEESQATGEVKAVFDEVKAMLRVPFVPQLFRALAVNPAHLVSTWDQLKTVMMTGTLDLRTKAIAALAVSAATRCPYFVSAHTAVLKRLGVTDAELEELMTVVQLAIGLNAYVDGLGLEPDLHR